MRTSPRTAAPWVAAAVVAASLLSACQERVATYDGTRDVVQAVVLTPDGDDGYRWSGAGPTLQAVALADNQGLSLRTLLWAEGSPDEPDTESCATWVRLDGANVQPGAALRVSSGEEGRIRAVTVTRNIYADVTWVFNVHVWDTAAEPPMELVGRIDLADFFRGRDAAPVRLCSRVRGSEVEVKVWDPSDPEPAWGDPFHGGAVDLPGGSVGSGAAGWYLAHLRAGETALLADLGTWAYRVPPPGATSSSNGAGAPAGDLPLQVEVSMGSVRGG